MARSVPFPLLGAGFSRPAGKTHERVVRRIAFTAALLLLLPLPALSQNARHAVLAGTIRDVAGDPVAGVEVTVSSTTTGAAASRAVTSDSGRYRLAFLIPSDDYILAAERAGFARAEQGPLALDPGTTTIRDLTLSTATGDSEESPAGGKVDVATTKTATVYNHEFIDGLPILGRTYPDVLTLAPGVNDVDNDGDPNVNGARDTDFQTRVDGFDVTDPLTGARGRNINLDAIAEVEVVTAGFPAEYGGAQGGYGNVLTRSGTNELDGALKLFFRSDLFDGDGANNNDLTQEDRLEDLEGYDDLRGFFSIGGAIVPDRAWYFAALEYIDTTIPVAALGGTILSTEKGWNNFLKLTFQPAARHRVSASWLWDPRTVDGLGRGLELGSASDLLAGLGLGYRISGESGYEAERGGYSLSANWTYNITPQLMVETTVGHLDTGTELRPASNTADCPLDGQGVCDPFQEDLYRVDLINGFIRGPFYVTTRDDRTRTSLRADVSYFAGDFGGTHSVVGGIEMSRSGYDQSIQASDVRYDAVGAGPQPGTLFGQIGFLRSFPSSQEVQADGRDLGLYIQDSYQPVPNVAINVGLRYDREESKYDGWAAIKPAAEAARYTELWEIGNGLAPGSVDFITAYQGGGVDLDINGDGKDNLHCSAYDLDGSTFGDGMADNFSDDFCTMFDGNFDGIIDPNDPFDVALGPCFDPAAAAAPDGVVDGQFANPSCDRQSDDNFTLISSFTRHQLDGSGDPFGSLIQLVPDRDGDGIPAVCPSFFNPQFPDFVPGVDCVSGELLDADDMPGTTRAQEDVEIVNNNLAPRLGVSWDPWSDNKTKFFASWGRYYDRVPLAALTPEQGPDVRFTIYDANDARFGSLAVPVSEGQFTVWQTDRDLATPFTDEWTVGIERELAPEWTVGLTYINRTGRDQLQDVDVNHFTVDLDQDGVLDDQFGRVISSGGGYATLPDGLPDLYVANPFMDQVFVIGNFNASSYESFQLTFTRRLGRRWQMQTSYVYSEAQSDGDELFSVLGDDPALESAELGFSDFDRTHVVKWYGVTYLPASQRFGWSVHWASGTPYSVITVRTSCDSQGNCPLRTSFDTGQRNDQRNEGAWDIDLSYRKDWTFGRYGAALSVEVDNLLNDDDLRLTSYQPGTALGVTGVRDFGRRWQLGVEFHF